MITLIFNQTHEFEFLTKITPFEGNKIKFTDFVKLIFEMIFYYYIRII